MRPSPQEYFLGIAKLVSDRSTCVRRKAGCVLVDESGYIRATGYNGVPKGFEHCIEESPCPGANSKSGTDLINCFAVHAEVNAFMQLEANKERVKTAYLTCTPCRECAKVFANSFVKKIYALEKYPDEIALMILRKSGIEVQIWN